MFIPISNEVQIRHSEWSYPLFAICFIKSAASAIISQQFTAHLQNFILAFITYRAPAIAKRKVRRRRETEKD